METQYFRVLMQIAPLSLCLPAYDAVCGEDRSSATVAAARLVPMAKKAAATLAMVCRPAPDREHAVQPPAV